MQVINAIGALKSAGFGEVVHADIRFKEQQPLVLPRPRAAVADRCAYWVTFDRPILTDAEYASDNVFIGNPVISGAIVKGVLADRLNYAGEDPEKGRFSDALASLRICHAWPESLDGRPSGMPLPLSLVGVKTKNGHELGDALRVPYGRGAMIGDQAAHFAPDWKAEELHDHAMQTVGLPKYTPPLHLPRTHTKIETTSGVAADEQLFTTVAYSERRPKEWNRPHESRRWLVVVDGGHVRNKEQLATLFALLEEGLEPLGKTAARATFTAAEEKHARLIPPVPIADMQYCFAIVLNTPAIIADPLAHSDLQLQYEAYFAEHCPGSALKNFFATQRFAGRYQATRRRPYGRAYYPFLLTNEGSVFLLEAAPDRLQQVKEKLAEFIRDGLPLPTKLAGAAPLNWRNCPFVPENGFGEITANYLSSPAAAALLRRVRHV